MLTFTKKTFWQRSYPITYISVWDEMFKSSDYEALFSSRHNGKNLVFFDVERGAGGEPTLVNITYAELNQQDFIFANLTSEVVKKISMTTTKNRFVVDIFSQRVVDESSFTQGLPGLGLETAFMLKGKPGIYVVVNPTPSKNTSNEFWGILLAMLIGRFSAIRIIRAKQTLAGKRFLQALCQFSVAGKHTQPSISQDDLLNSVEIPSVIAEEGVVKTMPPKIDRLTSLVETARKEFLTRQAKKQAVG